MVLITESSLRKLKLTGIPNPYKVGKGDKITPAAADFLRDNRISIVHENLGKHRQKNSATSQQKLTIPAGVSNRHVHLSQEHVEALYGKDYTLTALSELSQPGQFAAKETVTLLGPKGFIQNVRVLGPERPESQVEIAKTDGFKLGVHPPVRQSGDIDDTPGLTLIGPKGTVVVERGVIIAKAHIHMSPKDAQKFNVADHDHLMLQSKTDRPVIFPEVVVRVSERFALDFHVDLDEGNAANLKTGDHVSVIGKNGNFFA